MLHLHFPDGEMQVQEGSSELSKAIQVEGSRAVVWIQTEWAPKGLYFSPPSILWGTWDCCWAMSKLEF